MIDISQDIQPLTEFKRNTSEYLTQLKETGRPLVLTVNGRAELVVQDAASYQELLNLLEQADAVLGISKGLQSMARGEGIPLDAAFETLREGRRKP